MRTSSIALTVTLAVLQSAAALAYCPSGNPMDLRCSTSDFLNQTFGSVSYYMNNGPARWAEIASCTHPNPYMPPDPRWCAAAMRAQRIVTGAR